MTNKIAVTGAAKGLGKSISIELMKSGYSVFGLDIDANGLLQLERSSDGKFVSEPLDVSDPARVADFFKSDRAAGLIGLVNNAGIYLGKSLLDYADAEVLKVLNVNLASAIYCSRYFGARLVHEKREGAIVNLSSSSIYGGSDAVYSATKSGLIGLTKSCALKFSPWVRVNAVAPGIVETDIMASIPEAVIEWYRKTELVKKPLQPLDVANTVKFLLSEDARNYTGATFDLNNGFHL